MMLHALMALGAFIFSFFNRSRKTRIIGIVLVVLLLGGIGDTLINMGKIYPGVKVGTVDVGGKTQNEAAQILNDTYQARVSSNTAVFYANEEAKNNPTTTDSIATIDEQVSYEESLANRSQWTTPSSELGAQFDANASAEAAISVGRENGGCFFLDLPVCCLVAPLILCVLITKTCLKRFVIQSVLQLEIRGLTLEYK